MSHRFLTAEEATDHKLALFRLAAHLVTADGDLRAAEEEDDDPPPNPYDRAPAMRAAESTDLTRFEDQYKAKRLRELEAEHAEIDADVEAHPLAPRLTDAELGDDCTPPDGYTLALERMKRS